MKHFSLLVLLALGCSGERLPQWSASEYQHSIYLLEKLGYDKHCKPEMRVTEFVVCILEAANRDRTFSEADDRMAELQADRRAWQRAQRIKEIERMLPELREELAELKQKQSAKR